MRRSYNQDRYEGMQQEMDKLFNYRYINELYYPNQLANVVMVKKANSQCRMCINFTYLSKTYPKDNFRMPKIDQIVGVTIGHLTFLFIDSYSRYNYIQMFELDIKMTSFMTHQTLLCYKVMPFGLKNVGVTYQCLVNNMFAQLIGHNMEIYVDHMIIKNENSTSHVKHLEFT